MTRVSVELVPRSRSGLRAEIAEVAGALGGVDTVNVPDLTRYSDRKSTRLNSSHEWISRMPSSA